MKDSLDSVLQYYAHNGSEKFISKYGRSFRSIVGEINVEYSSTTNEYILYLLAKVMSEIDSIVWLSASKYLEINPEPPFHRFLPILHEEPERKKTKKSLNNPKKNLVTTPLSNEKILWTCWIFLQTDEYFHRKWNWSFLLRLQRKSESYSKELFWLSVECLALVHHLGPSMIEKLNNEKIDSEELSTISLKYILSEKRAIGSLTQSAPGIPACTKDKKIENSKFIVVPSRLFPLRLLELAVSSRSPVLLSGFTGTGKTMLLDHLAALHGKVPFETYHRITLSEETDGKALLGTYITDNVPGTFKWKRGQLVEAMTRGHWIVFEAIDRASSDVYSVLAPLLNGNSLYLPNEGLHICPQPDFRIFFTEQGTKDINILKLHSSPYYIQLSLYDELELVQIVNESFSHLTHLSNKIVETYSSIKKLTEHERHSTLRDLLKWCSRIQSSTPERINVFADGLDTLCHFISDLRTREKCARVIGRLLNFTSEEIRHVLDEQKPYLSISDFKILIGRVTLERSSSSSINFSHFNVFTLTKNSSVLLEFIGSAVTNEEPVLLVGETGVGKSATIQYLSNLLGKTLHKVNMSQESDTADLLGSYKPIDSYLVIKRLRGRFESLFGETFSLEENRKFLQNISHCFQKKDMKTVVHLMLSVAQKAVIFIKDKSFSSSLDSEWNKLMEDLKGVKEIQNKSSAVIMFSFDLGVLSKALQNGDWILLDEINLAESDTLELLADIIAKDVTRIQSSEDNETRYLKHKDFRIFACMNPATDVGKANLPNSLRNQFTEFYIHEPKDKSEIHSIVHSYLKNLNVTPCILDSIVNLYLLLKENCKDKLGDSLGNSPVFSLRTLCRALEISARNPCSNVQRSIFEAFSLCFLSELNERSYNIVLRLLLQYLSSKGVSILREELVKPECRESIRIEGYWIPVGTKKILSSSSSSSRYILTNSVRRNLKDVSRIVSLSNYPILLQGETSVGKTSMLQYLASLTGNHIVRINNHEHTDIQEYVGSYAMSENGAFTFVEGVLVSAMREGHWIILDELNLAPTEVLEALNRVLDDNRELFIAETQTVVTAHSNFRVFATQNPAGTYGGRKFLSRAFRNRFIQLHFSEIPSHELEIIIAETCALSPSMSKKIVQLMVHLQKMRKVSATFEGKRGFITLRDLFRWGIRFNESLKHITSHEYYDWNRHLAEEGYIVLGSRIRREEEMTIVKDAIERVFSVKLSSELLSFTEEGASLATVGETNFLLSHHASSSVVWTKKAQRMAILILHALRFKEPVLLVGETGCGKTSMVQQIADFLQRKLVLMNCHLNTETADFIGSLRPCLHSSKGLFEWVDGPLVNSMKDGSILLVDEISLADDSILERMNSVLESDRNLYLAEKMTSQYGDSNIKASSSFMLLATMNPGGDFGKKELSPSLRNRFFEIWCPSSLSKTDYEVLLTKSLKRFDFPIVSVILNFLDFLSLHFSKLSLSLRDLMMWIEFMNTNKAPLECSFIHGICLVLLDGYEMMSNVISVSDSSLKRKIQTFFEEKLDWHKCECFSWISSVFPQSSSVTLINNEREFGIHPFYISKKSNNSSLSSFIFDSENSVKNTLRLLRGMSLCKPILMEGPPGVGKSSMIKHLAKLTGNQCVRINFSDQTEVSDLFGTYLPVDSQSSTSLFEWKNGPLVNALISGSWILLDELNLASQAVLEGLNSLLDHRGSIYIPELNQTFSMQKTSTRIFGCQNPYQGGGDRKGLPKSFLNRFIRINVEALERGDFYRICVSKYPNISLETLSQIIDFGTSVMESSPGLFNLRDILRLCEGYQVYKKNDDSFSLSQTFLHRLTHLLFVERFESQEDKEKIKAAFEMSFKEKLKESHTESKRIYFNESMIQIGLAVMTFPETQRSFNGPKNQPLVLLPSQMPLLESLFLCLTNKWIPILIGDENVGKSSCVEIASILTRHKIRVLNLSAGSDTSELLGAFEQTDICNEVIKLEAIFLREDFKEEEKKLNIAQNFKDFKENLQNYTDEHLTHFLVSLHKVSSLESRERLFRLESEWKKYGRNKYFKWNDSPLVESLILGGIVILDHANFCSSSVLDRLNGLLEEDGVLELYEQGLVNGHHRRIVPHPNFRLIFIMNPKNGQLSPALRNRCVELFVTSSNYSHENIVTSIFGTNFSSALLSLPHSKNISSNTFAIGQVLKESLLEGYSFDEALLISSKLFKTTKLQGNEYNNDNDETKTKTSRSLVITNNLLSHPSVMLPRIQLSLLFKLLDLRSLLYFFLSYSSGKDVSNRRALIKDLFKGNHGHFINEIFSFPLSLRETPFDDRYLSQVKLTETTILTLNNILCSKLLFIDIYFLTNHDCYSENQSMEKCKDECLQILSQYSESLISNSITHDEEWSKIYIVHCLTSQLLSLSKNESSRISLSNVIVSTMKTILGTKEPIKKTPRSGFSPPLGFFSSKTLNTYKEALLRDFQILHPKSETHLSQLKNLLELEKNYRAFSSQDFQQLTLCSWTGTLAQENLMELFIRLKIEMMKRPSFSELAHRFLFFETNENDTNKASLRSWPSRISDLKTFQILIHKGSFDSVFQNKKELITQRVKCFLESFDSSISLESLTPVYERMTRLYNGGKIENNIYRLGELQMIFGLLYFSFYSDVEAMDPAEKKHLQHSIHSKLIEQTTASLKAFARCQILSDEEIVDDDEQNVCILHPHAFHLTQRLRDSTAFVSSSENRVPIRSENYRDLSIEIRHALRSLSPPFLLLSSENSITKEQMMSWKKSCWSCLNSILFSYPSFPDIVMPVMDGLSDMMEGAELMEDLMDSLNSHGVFMDLLDQVLPFSTPYSKEFFFQLSDSLSSSSQLPLWKEESNANPLDFYFGISGYRVGRQRNISFLKESHSRFVSSLPKTLSQKYSNSLPFLYSLFANEASETLTSVENSQVRELTLLLSQIEKRVNEELLLTFPANPLLTDISSLIQRLFDFSVTEFDEKFVEGAPSLCSKVSLWNAQAPRIHHVTLESLRTYLLDSQRRQLASLRSNLFSFLKKSSVDQEDAMCLWNTLLLLTQREESIKVTASLFRYLLSSSIGSFEQRLGCLQEYVSVLSLSYRNLIFKTLSPLLYYFNRYFRSELENKILSKVNVLEDKAKSLLKLKYLGKNDPETTSEYAKILKEFSSFLQEPLCSEPPFLNSKNTNENMNNEEENEEEEEKKKKIITLYTYELSFDTTIKKLSKNVVFPYGDLEEMTKKSIKILNSLQKMSLTRWENSRTLIDVSKSMKRSLDSSLSSHHKTQKQISIIFSFLKDTLGLSFRRGLLYNIHLLNMRSFSSSPTDFLLIESICKLDKLREVLYIPKSHMTTHFIQRCEGYISHGLSVALGMNSYISEFSEQVKELNDIITSFSYFGLERERCHWKNYFVKNISYYLQVNQVCRNATEPTEVSLLHFYTSHQKALEKLKVLINENHESSLLPLLEKLTETSSTCIFPPLFLHYQNHLKDKVNLYKRWSLSHQNSNVSSSSFQCKNEPLRQKIQKTSQKLLTVIQIYKKHVLTSILTDLDISSYKKAVSEELEVLDLKNILESVRGLGVYFQFLGRRRERGGGSDDSLQMIDSLTPLLRIYRTLVTNSLRQIDYFLHGSFLYYMNIISELFINYGDGSFSSESEESNEKEGSGEKDGQTATEGVGLGDGEAINNVTTDLKSQDLFEGEEESKDNQESDSKPNNEKEEDGVELDDDFSGNYDDKDDENSEQENSDEEKEENHSNVEDDVNNEEELDEDLWGDKEEESPEDSLENEKKKWESKDLQTEENKGEKKDEDQNENNEKNEDDEKNENDEKTNNDEEKLNNKDETKENEDKEKKTKKKIIEDEEKKETDDEKKSQEETQEEKTNEDDEKKEEKNPPLEKDDEENKRKRDDDVFSSGEEEDVDFTNQPEDCAPEPEDLEMGNDEDLNMDVDDLDENLALPCSEDEDDLEKYNEPNFEDTMTQQMEFEEKNEEDSGNKIPSENERKTEEASKRMEFKASTDSGNSENKSQPSNNDSSFPEKIQENEPLSDRDHKEKDTYDSEEILKESLDSEKDSSIKASMELSSTLHVIQSSENDVRDELSNIHSLQANPLEKDPESLETMEWNKDHRNLNKDSSENSLEERKESHRGHEKTSTEMISTQSVERPTVSFFSENNTRADSTFATGSKVQRINSLLHQLQRVSLLPPSSSSLSEWSHFLQSTSLIAYDLIAKLRTIFEPTKANRLQGDYKSGKRLNMKKIIPYIASDFRKDKIWLKRTKVSKRDYHVMFALDDSKSMASNNAHHMALESLASVVTAFNVLEIGKISITTFGESSSVIIPFKSNISLVDGATILREFNCSQNKTNLIQLLETATKEFVVSQGETSFSQLLIIISDGRGIFNEGRDALVETLLQAAKANIFIVFLIIDSNSSQSIMDIRYPIFDKTTNNLLRIESYMENFPFEFYILLRDINGLPSVMCDALQQWFHLHRSDH